MDLLPKRSKKGKIVMVLLAVSAVVSTVLTVLIAVSGFKLAKKAADVGANVLENLTGEGNALSVEARITELKRLRDEQLITTEEYETKRKEILDNL